MMANYEIVEFIDIIQPLIDKFYFLFLNWKLLSSHSILLMSEANYKRNIMDISGAFCIKLLPEEN